MKRRDLLDELHDIAREKSATLIRGRRGANHDIYRVGRVLLSVPRHRNVRKGTALELLKRARQG